MPFNKSDGTCPHNSVADTEITNDAASNPESFSRGYRAWLLSILMLVNLLNLADRQGLAAVAPATNSRPTRRFRSSRAAI